MKLYRINSTGTTDLTQLISRLSWSGDYLSCARTLEFEVVCAPADPQRINVSVENGDRVMFYLSELKFDGFVFSVQKGSSEKTRTIRCFDRGVWLNRNQGYYKFANTTPEAAARRIFADWGVTAGSVAATGYKFSRNYLGVSLYKIVQTGYTLASASTGKKYHIGFEGAKCCIREKAIDKTTLVIEAGVNLIDASVTESIEALVNRIRIVDKNYKLISTQEDAASIRSYGIFQEVLQQSDDSAKQAKQKLADGAATQKITVENLGDEKAITGRMAAVHDAATGLWGAFWIDSDEHTWTNGVYTNKLVLNFKNIMDEQEAGSLKSGS